MPLLWTLLQEHPEDTDLIYNLGIAHSELGEPRKAITILNRLIELAPKHVHGLVGLGVAHVRLQQLQLGEEYLRTSLELQPRNLWALRNLGACLLKQGKPAEAICALEKAVEVAPGDVGAIVGLGQAMEEASRVEEADALYAKAIKIGGPKSLIDIAMERRTAIAQRTMRARSEFRPDVMMYITGALDRFAELSPKDVQAIGIEIAILGQSGLDINDPTQKYTIRSLPGSYSGLHLCSIMYAAFRQFAPNQDVGIDFFERV